jgi:hypothetical protein
MTQYQHNSPRYPRGPAARVLVTLLLVVVLVVLILLIGREVRSALDPAEREQAAWERQYERSQAEQLYWLDTAIAAGWHALPLILVTAAGAAGISGLRRYLAWRAMDRRYDIELMRAQVQRFPAGLQSLSAHYNDTSRHEMAEAGPDEVLALPPPAVPTFSQLLDQGRIGPGRPLLLGFDAVTGQPIEGSWEDLYSCGIGALQGAGKTWLAAFLLAQSAAAGARLIVCDPNPHTSESLATRIAPLSLALICDVASTDEAILAALRMANDRLEERKAGSNADWLLIVAVDEWTSLLRRKAGDLLPEYVTNFAEQGRKYGVNTLLSAQGWTKDTAGLVRNRLTSQYVLRQRPDEARYQLGLPASIMPDDIRLLPDATGYLLTVRGDLVRVVIPQMTEADIARVATLIPRQAATLKPPIGFRPPAPTAPLADHGAVPFAVTATGADSNGTATGQQRDSKTELLSTASGSHKAVSPEAARAMGLFLAGKDIPAIVQELRGIDSARGGRRYRDAAKEITDLLRQAAQERT